MQQGLTKEIILGIVSPFKMVMSRPKAVFHSSNFKLGGRNIIKVFISQRRKI